MTMLTKVDLVGPSSAVTIWQIIIEVWMEKYRVYYQVREADILYEEGIYSFKYIVI